MISKHMIGNGPFVSKTHKWPSDMNHQALILTDTRCPQTASGFHKGRDAASPHQIEAAARKRKAANRLPQSFLEAPGHGLNYFFLSTNFFWFVLKNRFFLVSSFPGLIVVQIDNTNSFAERSMI